MNKGLIIGASSGIGEAIAEYLQTHADATQCEDWLMPGTDVLDVRSSAECYACIRQEGPFDYIIYSAGINELAWITQIGMQWDNTFENVWDVNCHGFVRIVGAHEHLFPEAGGSIVAISSDAARRPMRGSIAYCSSKAALDMSVRVMARELAPRWRVNAIAPGITDDTNMTRYLDDNIPIFRGWTSDHAQEYEKSQIPMGRRAAPGEIAEVAASVLIGPEYLTGAIIEVNGGRS